MKIPFVPDSAHACIGLIETKSIARGIQVADAMLKKASIEVLFSSPTSPGHYINLITGEVEEVRSSLHAGEETAGKTLHDSLFLPDVRRSVLQALYNIVPVPRVEALGILETNTQATLLFCADRAVKTTDVTMIHIHLGIGIGGKAFFILTGTYDDVEESMREASGQAHKRGALCEEVVIGNADPKLLDILLQEKLPQRK